MRDASGTLLLCVLVTGVVCMQDFIGKGIWTVNNVQQCADSDKYPIQTEMRRRKIDRTQDGFNISLVLPDDVTETSHGIYIELCKHVDGGCKIQHIIDEKSFCNFAKKYAKDNFVKALTMAGKDPADCPVKAGEFVIKNFVFDYSELPENGYLGHFEATTYLMKGTERVICIVLDINFG